MTDSTPSPSPTPPEAVKIPPFPLHFKGCPAAPSSKTTDAACTCNLKSGTPGSVSGEERTGSKNRVRMDNGVGYVEWGIDYSDGYRVTVGWSDEDDAWIARITGVSTGDVLAHGDTKEEALLALACSAAATIDAVNDPLPESPDVL